MCGLCVPTLYAVMFVSTALYPKKLHPHHSTSGIFYGQLTVNCGHPHHSTWHPHQCTMHVANASGCFLQSGGLVNGKAVQNLTGQMSRAAGLIQGCVPSILRGGRSAHTHVGASSGRVLVPSCCHHEIAWSPHVRTPTSSGGGPGHQEVDRLLGHWSIAFNNGSPVAGSSPNLEAAALYVLWRPS